MNRRAGNVHKVGTADELIAVGRCSTAASSSSFATLIGEAEALRKHPSPLRTLIDHFIQTLESLPQENTVCEGIMIVDIHFLSLDF